MPYFAKDSINFYFEGLGEGSPFIFSHGLGGSTTAVLDLIRGLQNLRLIIYDNRGHGRTNPLGDPSKLTFEQMADDMAALLDYLQIPAANVGGVSMGAGITLSFALRHRQRVQNLVLSRPAWLDFPNPPNLAFAPILAGLIEEIGLGPALAKFQKPEYYERFEGWSLATARSLQGITTLNEQALVASYRKIPASAPVDNLEKLRGVQAPVLVIGNPNDPVHPLEFAQIIARYLPHSRFDQISSKLENMEEHIRQFQMLVNKFLTASNRPSKE